MDLAVRVKRAITTYPACRSRLAIDLQTRGVADNMLSGTAPDSRSDYNQGGLGAGDQ
jgi:hypothetical protein